MEHITELELRSHHCWMFGCKKTEIWTNTYKGKGKAVQAFYRPWGFQEVGSPRFHDNRHKKVSTGRIYPQGNIPGCVDLRAIVRTEGLCQREIPMTPSGIEAATFRLVAQCFNRLWASMAAYGVSFTFIAAYYTEVNPRKGPEGEQRYSSTLSLTSVVEGVVVQRSAPAALPPGQTRYPLHRRLGGPQGRIWTGAENLACAGIRSLHRPPSSESLYQLSYPGPGFTLYSLAFIIVDGVFNPYPANVENMVSS
jgi:hypothetical protein